MRKKKEITEFTVQKSKALSLIDENFSLVELKIMDAVLAKMDNFLKDNLSQEELTEKISINKINLSQGELEQILGVSTINKSWLQSHLEKMLKPVDIVNDDEDEDHIDKIMIFERIRGAKDNTGNWNLEFILTESSKKAIFIPEHMHYIKYRLKNIIHLKSKYSYMLYNFLEDNRFKSKEIKVSLISLKQLFGVENNKSYESFKIFNRDILKVVQKELNEKTNCKFTIKTERPGNKVYYVIFCLEDRREDFKIIKPPHQITMNDLFDEKDNVPIDIWQDDDKYSVFSYDMKQRIHEYRKELCPPFNEILTDKCLIACGDALNYMFGSEVLSQYGCSNVGPFGDEILAFNYVLQRVYTQYNINEIEDINKYVLTAVQNYCKYGQ